MLRNPALQYRHRTQATTVHCLLVCCLAVAGITYQLIRDGQTVLCLAVC
jgi:hypothetical protein